MLYYYFRVFNWICCVFGLRKPFPLLSGKSSTITYWDKLWSILIVIGLIATYLTGVYERSPASSKINLHRITNINELVVNIIIILIDVLNGDKACLELYGTIDNAFTEFRISNRILKTMSLKLYAWFSLPIATYVASVFVEIFLEQPLKCIPLVRMPCLITSLYVLLHLYLVLAVLKLINIKLSQANAFHTKLSKDSIEVMRCPRKVNTLKYFLDLDIFFIDIVNVREDVGLMTLCKVYDELSTCIKLLEKQCGTQMLLSVWMMFSSAVIGATLISCEKTDNDWMVLTGAMLPVFWFFLCSFVNDRLCKEVEWTEILIMKHLIDFRCDMPRRNILKTFKQLVRTNGLQFTAGNLFHLNYAMILGTTMNVITYTIILVQLFISSD